MGIGLLQQFVPNEGTGWQFTIDTLGSFYEKILGLKEPAGEIEDLIGPAYLESVRILGNGLQKCTWP